MILGRGCSLSPLLTLFSYFQFSYFQRQLNQRMHRKGLKERARRVVQQRPNASRKTAALTTPPKIGGYYIWARSRRPDWMPCASAFPTLRGFPQVEFGFAKFRGSIELTTETHQTISRRVARRRRRRTNVRSGREASRTLAVSPLLQCLHSAEADVRPPRRKSGFAE
jgi:hypothetical protein